MLLGVLLYGGAVFFLRRTGEPPSTDPEQMRQLIWIGRGMWAMVVIGCAVLWQVMQRTESRQKKQSLSIIGWALGEGAALYGATVWFLTGASSLYVPGLVFLLLTFLIFPAARN